MERLRRFLTMGSMPDAANRDVLRVKGMVEKRRRRTHRRPYAAAAGMCWTAPSLMQLRRVAPEKRDGSEIQLTTRSHC